MNSLEKVSLLILGVLIVGFFYPLIFLDQLPSFRDMYVFAYPMKVFAGISIREGLIPLWDPYLGAGMPFLANLQSEVFYPPNFLFYFLPSHLALKLFIVLHFFLSGAFTYFFTRELDLSRFSALFSAVVFTFSGSLLSTIDTTSALCTTTWLPLVLLFHYKLLKTFKPRWIFLTGFVLAIQFLGGFPEVFLITLFCTGWMTLIHIKQRYGTQGLGSEVRGRKTRVYRLLLVTYCLLPIIIAMGLVMGQLLPFLELMGLSTRGQGLTYDAASQGAFYPGHLIRLLIPDFYGNPMEGRPTPLEEGWLRGMYIGILPLILAILGVLSSRPFKTLFVVLSLFFVLLSLGDHFFLYRILFPFGLGVIRFPSKFFIPATLTLSVLSGYGIEKICVPHFVTRNRREITAFLVVSFVAGTIGVLTWTKFGLRLIPELYGWQDASRLEWVEAFFSQTRIPSFQFLGIFFISSGILLFFLYQKLSLTLFKGTVLILVTLDLFIHNTKLVPTVSRQVFGFPTRTIHFLKTESADLTVNNGPQTFRVYSAPLTHQGVQFLLTTNKYDERTILTATDLLVPNTGLIFQIPNAMAKGSIELASYERYHNKMTALLRDGIDSLLDRLNVKYVVSTFPINLEGFNLRQKGPIQIFENTIFFPRAYVVTDEVGRLEMGQSEIPVDRVIPANIEQVSPHHIKVDMDLPTRATKGDSKWLIVSNQYYPGWKVYEGERDITSYNPIYERDGLFMGLKLSSDIREIEFKYYPASFKIGLFISLWTILILAIFYKK
jgi:hypothetical protein